MDHSCWDSFQKEQNTARETFCDCVRDWVSVGVCLGCVREEKNGVVTVSESFGNKLDSFGS